MQYRVYKKNVSNGKLPPDRIFGKISDIFCNHSVATKGDKESSGIPRTKNYFLK